MMYLDYASLNRINLEVVLVLFITRQFGRDYDEPGVHGRNSPKRSHDYIIYAAYNMQKLYPCFSGKVSDSMFHS